MEPVAVSSATSSVAGDVFDEVADSASQASSATTSDELTRAVVLSLGQPKTMPMRPSPPETFIRPDPEEENQDKDEKEDEAEKKRRRRTNPRELAILETHFSKEPLPDAQKRAEIAEEIGNGMTVRAVQIWFQNKRQTLKKKALLAQYDDLKERGLTLPPIRSALGDMTNTDRAHENNRLKFKMPKSKSMTLACTPSGAATVVSTASQAYNSLTKPGCPITSLSRRSISAVDNPSSAPVKKLRRSNSSFCPVHGKTVVGLDVEKGAHALFGIMSITDGQQVKEEPKQDSPIVDETQCAEWLLELGAPARI